MNSRPRSYAAFIAQAQNVTDNSVTLDDKVGPCDAGAIQTDGSTNFVPPTGWALILVELDLPANTELWDPVISADGSTLIFQTLTHSLQADPGQPGFESDLTEIFVLPAVYDIIGGISPPVTSLSDPRVVPIRTEATDPAKQRVSTLARISEDNELVVFTEDFGFDGLGSKFASDNPSTSALSDFDVMLANADGSTIDSANDSNDFRFANNGENFIISGATPGGLRVLSYLAPTGGFVFEAFLFTFTGSDC